MAEMRPQMAAVVNALVKLVRDGELPSVTPCASRQQAALLLARLEARGVAAVAWKPLGLPCGVCVVAAPACRREPCRPTCPCRRTLTPAAAADSLPRHWLAHGPGRLRMTAALLADLLAAPSDAG
jgi:hypothetical protein